MTVENEFLISLRAASLALLDSHDPRRRGRAHLGANEEEEEDTGVLVLTPDFEEKKVMPCDQEERDRLVRNTESSASRRSKGGKGEI